MRNERPTATHRHRAPLGLGARLALIACGLGLLVLAELVARGLAPLLSGAPADAWVDGAPPPFIRQRSSAGQLNWVVHPAWRYAFPAESFAVARPDSSSLVFCLGGSTVYGYPFAADFAFPARLERLLDERHAASRVQVVNAGGMSYGSSRLRRLAEQLVAYEPQLMVIYTGNNEFVEWDLGASDESRSRLQSAAAAARRLVLVRSLETLLRPAMDVPAHTGASEFGIDVRRREARVVQRQDRLLTAQRFARNLAAIVHIARDHGVTPILCTVGCNLADWRPENAAMAHSLSPSRVLVVATHWARARAATQEDAVAAAAHYRAALAIDPEYATLSYEAAELAVRQGEMGRALRLFTIARDHDPIPIRVLPELNEMIRRVADELQVPLVDVEALVQAASPQGIPGRRSYLDYCHYNEAGHELVARSLLPVVEQALGLPPSPLEVAPLPPAPSAEELAKDNGFALWWLGNVELRQGRADTAEQLLRRAVELKPDASQPLVGLAQVLQTVGRGEEALELLRTAAQRAPDGDLAYFNIVLQLALGVQLDAQWRDEEALTALEKALALDPSSGQAQLQLGNYHLRRKNLAQAFHHLRAAAQLHPNLAGIHRSLGLAQIVAGNNEAAARAFLEELRRHPDDARASYRLAETSAVLGALPMARQAVELTLLLDPTSRRAAELAELLQRVTATP